MSGLHPCPDCGKAVSKSAPACPNCGRPFGGQSAGGPQMRPHVTTESTAKIFKAQMLAAGLLSIGAATAAFAGIGKPTTWFIALAGFVWLAVVRVYAWWHHG